MNKQTMAGFGKPNERLRLRLTGPSTTFDPRSTAIRSDLADVAEAQRHLAPHYAASTVYACAKPWAMVRATGSDQATAVTQLLYGETFHLLDVRGGWAWGYCAHDHYVGYIRYDMISRTIPATATHLVEAGGAPVFTNPDIKSPVAQWLPAGGRVHGIVEGDYLTCTDGFLHTRHISPIDHKASNWVSIAYAYLGMPYLWGGRGGAGIDCSGLVQAVLAFCGHAVERDTDQQASTIGVAIDPNEPLIAGDLVFFHGHVGIMADSANLLHANAHWMRVTVEPLADVVARLVPHYAEPITARRRIAP